LVRPTAVRVLPGQAILFAGIAYNALGVLIDVETFAWLERILVLCFYIASADIDCVSSSAPMRRWRSSWRPAFASKYHLPPNFTNGTGKGQSSSPTRRNARLPSLDLRRRFSFGGLCSEGGSTLTVLRVFTRENDIVTIGSENHFQSLHVKLLSCVDKFIGSLLGSVEHLCVHAGGYGRGF